MLRPFAWNSHWMGRQARWNTNISDRYLRMRWREDNSLYWFHRTEKNIWVKGVYGIGDTLSIIFTPSILKQRAALKARQWWRNTRRAQHSGRPQAFPTGRGAEGCGDEEDWGRGAGGGGLAERYWQAKEPQAGGAAILFPVVGFSFFSRHSDIYIK